MGFLAYRGQPISVLAAATEAYREGYKAALRTVALAFGLDIFDKSV